MLIREMFEKEIDRDIQGVIIVGQSEAENVAQELDEYVVTRELQKHFADFFSTSVARMVISNTLVLSLLTILISFPVPIIFALLLKCNIAY